VTANVADINGGSIDNVGGAVALNQTILSGNVPNDCVGC
jgi:hypothetical protein